MQCTVRVFETDPAAPRAEPKQRESFEVTARDQDAAKREAADMLRAGGWRVRALSFEPVGSVGIGLLAYVHRPEGSNQ